MKGFENDSVGNQLHKRLRARFDNPDTENWLAELYPVRRYLRQRSSLLGHQSYFGTHPLPRTNVNVSSRAATIILAVHKFKTALETGQLVQQHVYGQAVDSDSYHWLFNACREPGLHEDRLVKHASNDDIVVMKQGIMFRVPLKENGVLVPHSQLASTLTAISDSTDTHGNPDISALTMDERDEWAKVRRKNLIGPRRHTKMAGVRYDQSSRTQVIRMKRLYSPSRRPRSSYVWIHQSPLGLKNASATFFWGTRTDGTTKHYRS